jgi:hypothetical protein
MKKILMAVFMASLLLQPCRAAIQTLPFVDHFSHVQGNLYAVATGIWDSGGNTGPELFVTNSASLTSPQYFAPASGNGVRWMPSGSARRSIVQFTSASSGDLYASFLINIVNPPSSGNRLVAYFDSSTSQPSSPQLGVFVGNNSIGVGKRNSTPAATVTVTSGTHLVVVRYTFTGTATDTVDLWVDPPSASYGAAEAATGPVSASGGNNSPSIPYFGIYAASGSGPSLYIDEVRIGTNWSSVVPGTPPIPQPDLPHLADASLTAEGLVLRATNGTPNGGFELLETTDISIAQNQWPVIATNQFDNAGNSVLTNPITSATTRFFRLRTGTNAPPAVGPSIHSQPQNQEAPIGGSAQFDVSASGTPPLHYQWYFNTNTLLSGQTNSTLLITGVSSNDAGAYSVIVSNAVGSTNSSVAILSIAEPPTNGTYFVSTTGSDLNPGTSELPFASVAKAVSLAEPGDVIYVRGGTYFPSQTILVNRSGTSNDPIQLLAYPGEKPVLDFVNQPYGSSNRGFLFTTNGNYWHMKGFEVARAGDNAIKIESSHCIFELLTLHHNGDSGLQIGFAHETDNPGANLAAFIQVINCDSYMNYDSDNRGSDADGFAAKLHCGREIIFVGCRAWENSDDGWDLFETDASVVISNCWTWHNGDGSLYPVTGGSFQGNGNGFKLGGNGAGGSSEGVHYVYNCVSFNNNFPGRTRHGFDQNSHHGGNVLYNCVAWNNLYNYFFEDGAGSNPLIFRNNVSFSGAVSDFVGAVEDHNSWSAADHSQVNPAVGSFSAADFNSITETAAKAPRQPDGSFPSGFARLMPGSNLKDKGVDVGIPFSGSAPDLGAYEFAP